MLARGFFGFLGVYGTFYSIMVLPVSIAMAIIGLTPVFVIILGALFKKESIHFEHIFYALISALMVFLISNPADQSDSYDAISIAGVCIALLSSISTAMAFLAVRKLTTTVGAPVIVFWFGLCCTAGFFIVHKDLSTLTSASTLDQWLLLIICLLGVSSDLTKTKAYQYGKAWFVSLLSVFSIVVSGIVAWLVLNESIQARQWLSILMLMFVLALSSYRSRNR